MRWLAAICVLALEFRALFMQLVKTHRHHAEVSKPFMLERVAESKGQKRPVILYAWGGLY